MANAKDLPPGQVDVSPHGQGWLLIQIGRGRYTKRFNISVGEAAELVRALEEHLTAS